MFCISDLFMLLWFNNVFLTNNIRQYQRCIQKSLKYRRWSFSQKNYLHSIITLSTVQERYCFNLTSYSVLFMSKKLCRAKALSGVFNNLRKQKLAIIKSNNLNKNLWKLWWFGVSFSKEGISGLEQEKWTSS